LPSLVGIGLTVVSVVV